MKLKNLKFMFGYKFGKDLLTERDMYLTFININEKRLKKIIKQRYRRVLRESIYAIRCANNGDPKGCDTHIEAMNFLRKSVHNDVLNYMKEAIQGEL